MLIFLDCGNGVHGWIYLNKEGKIIENCNSDEIPKFQLLLVDGRIAYGLIPELLLPNIKRIKLYSEFIRPFLFKFLNVNV